MKRHFSRSYLVGEDNPEPVDLLEWVIKKRKENTDPPELYEFLEKSGKYFPLSTPPKTSTLPIPEQVKAGRCHANSVFYAVILYEKYPELMGDFQFVSGVYRLHAIDSEVPKDRIHSIAHHSFLTYKGINLDWTILEYPPRYYEVNQYFGVAFSIETVVETYEAVMNQDKHKPFVPLMELRKKPFLVS